MRILILGFAFFGAEGEIRTRATFNSTTPLAGEPLEPLGYFCNGSIARRLYYYNIILADCQSIFSLKIKKIIKFSFPPCNTHFFML